MSEISGNAANLSSTAEEQDAATQEISNHAHQAAERTIEVSSSIQSVSKTASETDRMSGELLSAANEVSVQAEGLNQTANSRSSPRSEAFNLWCSRRTIVQFNAGIAELLPIHFLSARRPTVHVDYPG